MNFTITTRVSGTPIRKISVYKNTISHKKPKVSKFLDSNIQVLVRRATGIGHVYFCKGPDNVVKGLIDQTHTNGHLLEMPVKGLPKKFNMANLKAILSYLEAAKISLSTCEIHVLPAGQKSVIPKTLKKGAPTQNRTEINGLGNRGSIH